MTGGRAGFGRLVAGGGAFDPGRLREEAVRRAGTAPELDPGAEEGLEALCRGLSRLEPDLSFLGRKLLQAALVETLTKAARLPPGPAVAPVAPIAIVAPFRSGTTLLHRLLAQDPRLRAPRTYEVSMAPPASGPDPRPALVEAYLGRVAALSPEVLRLHPTGARESEECFGLLEPSFRSPSFLFWAPMPDYLAWLGARPDRDWDAAYATYARGLSGLGHAARWLLKSPVHLWGLGALLRAFPDATVIQLHRDPKAASASFGRLVAAHHAIHARRPDPLASARYAEGALSEGIARAAMARQQEPDRFVDLAFEDLVADPLASVARLWPRLGLDPDPEVLERMKAWLLDGAAKPA